MFLVLGLLEEVVDEDFWVDLFLDVERRGVDDEVAPVLLILPAPDELGIEVGIPRVADLFGILLFLLDKGLLLGGRDVLPLRLIVLEGLDRFGGGDSSHENQELGACAVSPMRMEVSAGLMK